MKKIQLKLDLHKFVELKKNVKKKEKNRRRKKK